MMDSTADDGDFPPNPFRSGGGQQAAPQQQQQQQQMPSQQQMQQQPQMVQEQEDFFTNPTPAIDPLSAPSPMDSSMNTNNMNNNIQQPVSVNNNNGSMQAVAPKSWWQSCRACCTMQTYQQYFDVDTVDIKTRLMGSILHFYQPDYFRTNVIGVERNDQVKGPDLYGPFWVTMTLVFLVAVSVL
jgi:hypothetical protein